MARINAFMLRASKATSSSLPWPVWQLLLCLAGGVYLVFAIPITLPGDPVAQVQEELLGLNFLALFQRLWVSSLTVFGLGLVMGTALFVLINALVSMRLPERAAPRRFPKGSWLLYALPMIVVWGVVLLAFWPAILSRDSIDQWQQVQNGQYHNAHPVFHTLFLWLVTRVWNSPTIVAVIQIVALSLSIAWLLGYLRQKGLPNWAAWAVSFVFALSPVNATMAITLWKDFFYSLSVFLLSAALLVLAFDEQKVAEKKSFWVVLGLVVACITLFRHNGLLVGPPVLIGLLFFYPRYRKRTAGAFAIFLVFWLFVQVPLMFWLKVEQTSYLNASLGLHHIAAQINSSAALSPAEEELVYNILPARDWKSYYCYTANSITYHANLNTAYVKEHIAEINALAARLALRSPTVEIRHVNCAGSMVWRIREDPYGYLYTSGTARNTNGEPVYVAANQMGIEQQSLLPGIVNPLVDFIHWTSVRVNAALIWRPAFFLYLHLLIGCVLAVRLRSWKVALFMLPGVLQSSSLALVNIAQDFRYQYAVYLLGLFSLALLFLPSPNEETLSDA